MTTSHFRIIVEDDGAIFAVIVAFANTAGCACVTMVVMLELGSHAYQPRSRPMRRTSHDMHLRGVSINATLVSSTTESSNMKRWLRFGWRTPCANYENNTESPSAIRRLRSDVERFVCSRELRRCKIGQAPTSSYQLPLCLE